MVLVEGEQGEADGQQSDDTRAPCYQCVATRLCPLPLRLILLFDGLVAGAVLAGSSVAHDGLQLAEGLLHAAALADGGVGSGDILLRLRAVELNIVLPVGGVLRLTVAAVVIAVGVLLVVAEPLQHLAGRRQHLGIMPPLGQHHHLALQYDEHGTELVELLHVQ